ncbi:hypothetical protein SAMN05216516_101360 [Izhakiella capsodis]|uniref:Uncharacterized protein n=1 Tax=Izhakiella capsodis TaxID=1367852 RepID=A0A1I4UUI4_9GAMM|nr:hypothetical protein SAMN05216516_101360 [Izhakiella capsodis]
MTLMDPPGGSESDSDKTPPLLFNSLMIQRVLHTGNQNIAAGMFQ